MLKIFLVSIPLITILVLGYLFLSKNYFYAKSYRVGVVEATFILSPAEPVCGTGGSSCVKPMRDYPVDIFRQDNNTKSYSGKTDGNGKFAGGVLPGDYYFFYHTGITSKARKDFTVKAGETVKLQITVDTGIR